MPFYEKIQQGNSKLRHESETWEEEGTRYREAGQFRKEGRRPERKIMKKTLERSDDIHSQRKKYGNHLSKNSPNSAGEKNSYRTGIGAVKNIDKTRGRSYSRHNDSMNSSSSRFSSQIQKPDEDKPNYSSFEFHRTHETPVPEDSNILCGRNPIREALRSGRDIEKLLVQKGELNGSAREIVQTAREKKIMVQEVDKRRLDEISLHHQGLIAFASAYEYSDLEDILAEADRRNEPPFLILLDGVTDPHNLGAIIRTAECAGAHGVILPTHRSVGLTPAAVKASAGAIEHIKVARVLNLNRTIDDLKRRGIWVYAVTMNGKDYEKTDFQGGTALVIGAEGEGISRLTIEKCDMSVSLPLCGKIDSLNASVAAGIVTYRVLSCRRKAEKK